MYNLIAQVFPMNPEYIDISANDPLIDGPPVPALEPTTNDVDIFQGHAMSYSWLMSQITLDPSAGTSGT
jgi:hypothetical protein